MEANGFEIIDLGIDVAPEQFVKTVKKEKPDLLLLSCLYTVTMHSMEDTIIALKKAGLKGNVKTLVGGAPVTKEFADSIGADGFGIDAMDGVKKAKELLAGRKGGGREMASNHESLHQAPDADPAEKNAFFRILDSFQEAMKLQVRLFPLKGKGEISSIDGDGHPFCEIIRRCSPGRDNCLKDINRAIQISIKTGEPYIFQCHADMIEFTAALPDGGENPSAFVCGPILLRHPNPFIEQSILGKVKSLSLDEASLMRTLPEIPVFSERRVQAAADLLFMIANYFSKVDAASQQRQHEITRQQALLAEGLFLSKVGSRTMRPSPLPSSNQRRSL